MCRGWGISPPVIWGMTLSEILHEYEWRRPHMPTDYAGGMTEHDIETIKAESAELRQLVRAKRHATTKAA